MRPRAPEGVVTGNLIERTGSHAVLACNDPNWPEGPMLEYALPSIWAKSATPPVTVSAFAAPGANLSENLVKLLASPALASKRWITG